MYFEDFAAWLILVTQAAWFISLAFRNFVNTIISPGVAMGHIKPKRLALTVEPLVRHGPLLELEVDRQAGLLRQPLGNRHAEQRPAGVPVGGPIRGVREHRVERLVGDHAAHVHVAEVAALHRGPHQVNPATRVSLGDDGTDVVQVEHRRRRDVVEALHGRQPSPFWSPAIGYHQLA